MNRTSGRIRSNQARISPKGPNSGHHSSLSVSPWSYTCSIDGAWDAPMPPMIRAISTPLPSVRGHIPCPLLSHLLADLHEWGAGHADQLDHRVDRHTVAPELDPVVLADQAAFLLC